MEINELATKTRTKAGLISFGRNNQLWKLYRTFLCKVNPNMQKCVVICFDHIIKLLPSRIRQPLDIPTCAACPQAFQRVVSSYATMMTDEGQGVASE